MRAAFARAKSIRIAGPALKTFFEPCRRAARFYQIAGAMLFMSLVISGTVGSVDVRANPMISARAIWVGEATSHVAIFLLLPIFPLVLDRLPALPARWGDALGRLGLGLAAFWLLHITLMWVFRLVLFPLAIGQPYNVNLFAPRHLSYEFSKDIFTYALLVFGFVTIKTVLALRAKAATPAEPAKRIALRSGATTHHVVLDDIISASAAANYVEVRLENRSILARMSLSKLSELAASKSAKFIQVHRSHLVNKDKIKTVIPRGDGGVHIEMVDGSQVPGSRRFRNNLGQFAKEISADE